MPLLLLSVCLSIFTSEIAATSEPYYAITVPAQMLYPSEDKACVTFYKLKGQLQLKMELKNEDKSVLVAEDTINTPIYFHCYSFELPTVEKDEVWFFHVSAHGDSINIDRSKKILLIKGFQFNYIQTDKPIYKPGQTVNFRLITLDKHYHAKNHKYPLVELLDTDNNRIGQWLDVSPRQGIADLSFPLADELPLGVYTINVPGGYKATFLVNEYVPKRFTIKVDMPETVGSLDKVHSVKACGSYSYGKPISGSFNLSVCKENVLAFISHQASLDQEDINIEYMKDCQHITGVHTDDKGCLSREIDLTFFNFTNRFELLIAKVSLTEEVSGHTQVKTEFARFYYDRIMEFETTPEFYQKGLPLSVKLKVRKDQQPIANETIYLVVGLEEEDLNLTSVTNENGLAAFTLDTSNWDDMVSLWGKFSLEEVVDDKFKVSIAHFWLHPLYSESNSFLSVDTDAGQLTCDSDQYLTVEYFINTSELDPADKQLHFFYLYVSKGVILDNGKYDVDIGGQSLGSVLQGNFKLKIPKSFEYYPSYKFVVQTILNNGDIPSFTREFTIPECLNNKVKLKFSSDEVRPGGKLNLEVQADAGSLCSVRSVDKGVLDLRKHDTLKDTSSMYHYISYLLEVNRRGLPYSIEDFEKYPCLRSQTDPQADKQEAAWYHGDADPYMMLKQSNLKIFTNTNAKKPVVCAASPVTRRISKEPHKKADRPTSSSSGSKEEKNNLVKRIFFPETWLFDLVSVGPEGRAVLDVTAPHTITTWETDAFCLGKSGYGEASGVKLISFQPYFIDLVAPYSVVQGEKFTITAYAFSSVNYSMMVLASISGLKDNPVVGDEQQMQCISKDQTASFTWNVSASHPGNLKIQVSSSSLQLAGGCTGQDKKLGMHLKEDTIEKTIVVKPSGILKENIQTFFLCPSGDSVRRKVSLEVPEKVVPGSEQAIITILGNIMGSAISNIGHSLSLPHGSAMQNLMTFIPISYIVKYLESTKELTPEIKENAITYLTKGYLRQLMFRKNDGSYSVYHGIPSSTWITAFTVRSFNHAQDLIYIQDKHINDAIKWFSSLQQPSGCFQEVGKIFDNYLVKESDNNVTLTAYITIALLEHGHVYDNLIVENALKCLKNAVNEVNDTYTQALLAYVFTLSGDSDLRKHFVDLLEKVAIKKDGNKYWAADTNGNGDTEISSYVLLTLLSDQTTSQTVIEEVSPVVNWIIKRQRPQGGFHSPQSTAVALQALTIYTKATYTDNPDVTVSLRSLSGFNRQFHVDKKNGLLTQRETLPDIPGEYTLVATGTGCAFIQTHLKYHTPLAKSDTFFALTASTNPSVCTSESKKDFDVVIEASYSGERTVTNEVILEVQLLSGFFPIKKSVRKLKANPIVEKTEVGSDKVTIYLEKLTHEAESFRFTIYQDLHVKNLQAAKVKIYDAYAPDEQAFADYNSPCHTENGKDT